MKVDRAFVRDLGSDLSDRPICESIISLARSMDLRTVAEGVETDFQSDWLKDHGIDEFQGFLLGRPAPFENVLALLSRQHSRERPLHLARAAQVLRQIARVSSGWGDAGARSVGRSPRPLQPATGENARGDLVRAESAAKRVQSGTRPHALRLRVGSQ